MEYTVINVGAEGSAVVATVEIVFMEDFKVITSFNMDEFNQKISDFSNANIEEYLSPEEVEATPVNEEEVDATIDELVAGE